MAKNPFKKQSIVDTLVNVGIGGAANVAIDYVMDQVDAVATMEDTTKNVVKIVGGALIGGMISNKYGRAAADGIAVVGVSNLISGLMDDSSTGGSDTSVDAGAEGLPGGTIGRIRVGSRAYRRAVSKNGRSIAGDFIGK